MTSKRRGAYSSIGRVLWPTIIIAALLGAFVRPGHAFASISICRADPIVVLSNGAVVQFGAAVSDTPADVSQIVYTLTVPAGTHLVAVYYTDGALSGKEQVQIDATNPPNTYDSTTLVTTTASGVPVTVETFVPGTGFSLATGLSNLPVGVHIAS